MTRTLIGSKIRDRRRALGTTQRALAQRAGISASYLNLIESNRRSIGGALLKRLADELEVPIDEFDGAAERRLVDDLTELATAPELASLHPEPRSAADLAAAHPAWARALVALHRACRDRSQAVSALSDRLNQDPFLGDAVHDLLSKVTAIRSACEILESGEALEPAQRERFLAMVGDDSRRLADVAGALASFFDKAHTSTRSVTPIEEVDDFISEHDNHFPRLEAAAEGLRRAAGLGTEGIEPALVDWLRRRHAVQVQRVAETERAPPGPDHAARFDAAARTLLLLETAPGSTRRFELARLAGELGCAEALDAELAGSTLLGSAAAQRARGARCRRTSPARWCCPTRRSWPRRRPPATTSTTCAASFGASFEQVCHRLVTLRRPGARRHPLRLHARRSGRPHQQALSAACAALPRYGNACPLWAVYRAFQTPGVRRVASSPSSRRRALPVPRARGREAAPHVAPAAPPGVDHARLRRAACRPASLCRRARPVASGAPATPVGQACRVCVRRDCAWRQEDPIVDAGLR